MTELPERLSSIPAALDGLLAGLRSRPALATVQIVDGADQEQYETESITIGLPDPDVAAVSGQQETVPLGAQRREETYEVLCEIAVASGDAEAGQTKVARDRAFVLFREVAAQLRAPGGDPTLSGAVRYAELAGRIDVQQGSSKDYPIVVLITFTVRCQQRV